MRLFFILKLIFFAGALEAKAGTNKCSRGCYISYENTSADSYSYKQKKTNCIMRLGKKSLYLEFKANQQNHRQWFKLAESPDFNQMQSHQFWSINEDNHLARSQDKKGNDLRLWVQRQKLGYCMVKVQEYVPATVPNNTTITMNQNQ